MHGSAPAPPLTLHHCHGYLLHLGLELDDLKVPSNPRHSTLLGPCAYPTTPCIRNTTRGTGRVLQLLQQPAPRCSLEGKGQLL